MRFHFLDGDEKSKLEDKPKKDDGIQVVMDDDEPDDAPKADDEPTRDTTDEKKSKPAKDKKGDKTPRDIRCKKCGNIIQITSTKRPIQIECDKCGLKGTLKK